MTEVAFHFGAPDKIAYACRLLRKAVSAGARLVVQTDGADCERLNAALWALLPTDFVAHCDDATVGTSLTLSPIVLTARPQDFASGREVIVNLLNHVPDGFDQFQRVIEVVSHDETDRRMARIRWKQYSELGYVIGRHDLTLKGATP